MRQTFTASLCGGLALAMLAGTPVAEAQIANRPKGGCLKYGAAGALAWQQGNLLRASAPQTQAFDTVGAGARDRAPLLPLDLPVDAQAAEGPRQRRRALRLVAK